MKNKGFSLIELLIVVAIIGVLTGLMVPAFQSIAGAGKIPSAANQIASILEFARNEAIYLTSFGSLKSAMKDLVPSASKAFIASLGTNQMAPAPVLQSGGVTFDRVLTFSPRGEAMLVARPPVLTGFNRLVDVSVRKTRGASEPQAEADDAVVLAGGSSGKVEILYQR